MAFCWREVGLGLCGRSVQPVLLLSVRRFLLLSLAGREADFEGGSGLVLEVSLCDFLQMIGIANHIANVAPVDFGFTFRRWQIVNFCLDCFDGFHCPIICGDVVFFDVIHGSVFGHIVW